MFYELAQKGSSSKILLEKSTTDRIDKMLSHI